MFGDPGTGETLCKIPSTRYNSTDNGRIITLNDMRSHESDVSYLGLSLHTYPIVKRT